MSDQGKANYEGYRAAAMGKSLVSGDPLPEWDELPHLIRLAWDAGACSVELWLAEAPVDEDMPGNEPAQTATVIVTTETGTEIRYRADSFAADGFATADLLDIRDTSRKGNATVVALYAAGSWRSVRLDGVTEPDTTRRQLDIAKAALALIARNNPENPRKVADEALEQMWVESE